MDPQPRISVGMPVFNGERYVQAAIESILAQSFGDFELIISDNASTDGTREICEALSRMDGRIRYHRNSENLGAAKNYNAVFGRARARYFRWANADDLSGPNLHQDCLGALEKVPEAVLAYGKTVLIDEEGDRIASYDDNLDLRQSSPCERFKDFLERVGLTNIIYGLMRTEAMRRGPLMGEGAIPAADVIFMADMAIRGQFVAVPEELFYRRFHSKASSSDGENKELQQEFWSAGKQPFDRPHLRRHKALMESASGADVPLTEKACLIGHVLRSIYWHRHGIAGELWPGRRRGGDKPQENKIGKGE